MRGNGEGIVGDAGVVGRTIENDRAEPRFQTDGFPAPAKDGFPNDPPFKPLSGKDLLTFSSIGMVETFLDLENGPVSIRQNPMARRCA